MCMVNSWERESSICMVNPWERESSICVVNPCGIPSLYGEPWKGNMM